MYEHMTIPGELTSTDVQSLVEQLQAIRLPDGRKPFTVETRHWANHEIYLKNECSTGVLLFHMAPKTDAERDLFLSQHGYNPDGTPFQAGEE